MNKMRTTRNTIIICMFLLHAIASAGWAGELVAWGADLYGRVSDTPTSDDFAVVSAGYYHNLALKSDGSLVAWGLDDWGQVYWTPAGNDFVSVAAGGYHSLALKSDGSLVAWGSSTYSQVSTTPTGNDFVAIAAGWYHSVALKSDGSLIAWGRNNDAQCKPIPAGNDFVAVAAGSYHNVALKSDGSLVAWGRDSTGQVSETPAGNDFIAVSAGCFHSIALKSDGSLIAWGSDYYTNTPVGNDFVAVSAGYMHTVALKSDGSLVVWGIDFNGTVNDSPAGNDFIAVSAGYCHNIVIRGDQTIPIPAPIYTLNTYISPSGSGYVTKNPDMSLYYDNDSVHLTATAYSGYTFSHWSGDVSSYSNPVTIIMNSNKSVTANFTAITKPTVSISATDASAGEPTNDGYFTVSRTGDTSENLLVYYTTSGSTASSGTDYSALSGYVYIYTGQSSATIAVDVIDDSTVESSETVRLTISSNAAYNIGSPSYATVTITDNDDEPPADETIVTITAPDASAGEPSNYGYFIVNRTGDTSSSLRVYYSTSGSTATAGTDYSALHGYVDLSSGQYWAVIYVIVIDDSTMENSETVNLTISSNTAYTVGSPSNATVTIADNDNAPPEDKPVVTITAPDAYAGEPANDGYFRVSRTGDIYSSLRVYYSTGGSTALSGYDYAALPGYVDISYGQSSANISVDVYDDYTTENSETVRLTISSNAAYDIGSPSYATVTITDDDDIPEDKPIVTITTLDSSAAEPANNGSFRLSRTGDTSENLRVYYSTSGTAFSGADYAALPGYVYILSGQSSATIYVDVIDDNETENSETVRLTISSNAAYDIGSPSYATVTITDDDDVPDPPVVDIVQLMADTVDFFDYEVKKGTLVSTGKGKTNLVILGKMLDTAYDQIVSGNFDGACGQLKEAYLRCDGLPDPTDYVAGTATGELAWKILEVIDELGCL